VPEVKFEENKILMDTGAGKGGILSAIDLETKKVYSSAEKNPIASIL
jgi:serine/threonine protein phosphatase 1